MFTSRLSMVLVLVALISIAALTVQEAVATSMLNSSTNIERMEQSRAADAARWNAMGEYYQSQAEAESMKLERGRSADAARWGAMAAYYQALGASQARAREADAARWTAIAAHYEVFEKALDRGRAADAARWTAMAAYYELIAPAR